MARNSSHAVQEAIALFEPAGEPGRLKNFGSIQPAFASGKFNGHKVMPYLGRLRIRD